MPKTESKKKHIHKFMKVTGKRVRAWRCVLDDCRYLLHSGIEELILGRISKCWSCDAQFKMDEDSLNEDMPVCVSCRLKSKGINVDEINQIIGQQVKNAPKPVETETLFTKTPITTPNQSNQPKPQEDIIEIDEPTLSEDELRYIMMDKQIENNK